MDPKVMSEIATHLKRIADALERREKRELIQTGGVEKLKEAMQLLKSQKDELLPNVANQKNGNTRRS